MLLTASTTLIAAIWLKPRIEALQHSFDSLSTVVAASSMNQALNRQDISTNTTVLNALDSNVRALRTEFTTHVDQDEANFKQLRAAIGEVQHA